MRRSDVGELLWLLVEIGNQVDDIKKLLAKQYEIAKNENYGIDIDFETKIIRRLLEKLQEVYIRFLANN